MERYAKEKLELWDLADVYQQEFEEAVPEPFPSMPKIGNLKSLYYKQGLEFLENFSGYDDLKILEVETAFDYPIDDWIFNGVIDLTYETSDGKLVIHDYKSKGDFRSKREISEYARQLYLYSLYVKEKYGRYPDLLVFDMFRKQKKVTLEFDENKFEEAIQWAKDTVKAIRECWDFSPNCEKFFSEQLCNHRSHCDLKN